MSKKIQVTSIAIGAAAALGAAALAIPAIADAASSAPSPSPSSTSRHHGAETELSGSAAAKVKAAVLAKLPGATIHRMSKEDTAEKTGAVYEAHVTKADGSRVEVLLDKNFKVLSTRTNLRGGPEGGGPGHWGRGGPDGRHGQAEKELSGTTAGKVKAAVLAKLPGATVERMSAEDPAEKTGAAYEAHVTKADGTHVTVLLDKNFKVLSTKTETRHSGFDGPPTGDTPSTPNAGYGAVGA
jgi:uncharacterized membrane protein YkoI